MNPADPSASKLASELREIGNEFKRRGGPWRKALDHVNEAASLLDSQARELEAARRCNTALIRTVERIGIEVNDSRTKNNRTLSTIHRLTTAALAALPAQGGTT